MMQIVAVVDANAESVIVWHVDLSATSPVLSRMCGAWVVNNEPNKVELLTRDRLVVSTPAGMEALAAIDIRTTTVDLESTFDQVVAERDRLQGLYDALPPSRRKTLVAPRWPHLPTNANSSHPPHAETPNPTVAVTLRIARYLEQLILTWTAIEGQRTSRHYLNDQASEKAPATRELPIVFC